MRTPNRCATKTDYEKLQAGYEKIGLTHFHMAKRNGCSAVHEYAASGIYLPQRQD